MKMETALSMALFALAMSISPGPVNLITLATGNNFGVRNAIPFVSGATIGFTLLLILIGLGLGEIAGKYRELMQYLAYAGACLIIYVGFKIALAEPKLDHSVEKEPSFMQGFLLQWLNPKAWGACIAAVSLFELSNNPGQLAIFVLLYFALCFFGIGSWAVLGHGIQRLLSTAFRIRLFNGAVGTVLIGLAFTLAAGI